MKKIAVKFCGGCNPRFDRGAVFARIKEACPHLDFESVRDGENYEAVLIIRGCTGCDFENFLSPTEKILLTYESETEDAIKILKGFTA